MADLTLASLRVHVPLASNPVQIGKLGNVTKDGYRTNSSFGILLLFSLQAWSCGKINLHIIVYKGMHLNFLRFLAVTTGAMFIFGNVAAAEWQPLPGGREGTFYDVQSVINEKGNYHVIEREYIHKDRLATWGGAISKNLQPGAYIDYSHLMNCQKRRTYEMFVQFYDHAGKKISYLDGRGKPASESIDDIRFDGAHNNLFLLFNKLCGSSTKK